MADRNEKGQFYKGMVGAHRSHGLGGTRFYRIYNNMQERCRNPKNIKYHRYGARGIKCLWKSFEDFKDDMYTSYTEHIALHGESDTSIDRTNNDGNYEKGNCRWATKLEQARNTSQNRLISFNGKTLTLGAWSDETGISRTVIQKRLKKGWDLKRVFQPKAHYSYEYAGKKQSLARWAEELRIPYGKLWDRLINHKWTPERAFTTR